MLEGTRRLLSQDHAGGPNGGQERFGFAFESPFDTRIQSVNLVEEGVVSGDNSVQECQVLVGDWDCRFHRRVERQQIVRLMSVHC